METSLVVKDGATDDTARIGAKEVGSEFRSEVSLGAVDFDVDIDATVSTASDDLEFVSINSVARFYGHSRHDTHPWWFRDNNWSLIDRRLEYDIRGNRRDRIECRSTDGRSCRSG